MTTSTKEELRSKHCKPCEGGTPPLTYETVRQPVATLRSRPGSTTQIASRHSIRSPR